SIRRRPAVSAARTHPALTRSSLPIRVRAAASASSDDLPSSSSERGVENLVIIGSGPAGYTAAIYAARANLKPVVFEGYQMGGVPGGQLMTTTEVENSQQAERWGAELFQEDVEVIDVKNSPFTVVSSERKVKCHSVIVATGANARRLGLPREDEFWSRGISACAICDGASPLLRGKFLLWDQLRASKAMQDRCGHSPNSQFLEGQVKLDDSGYLLVEEGTAKTSVEGVFAAGDVQDHEWRQAVTAAGSGCIAALSVERYLASNNLLIEFHQPKTEEVKKEPSTRDVHEGFDITLTTHRGQVIDEYDQNVHFVEIDIEEDPEIAEAAGIMGTPCVQFFKNKEMIRTVSGVKMKKEYKEFIEANK
ncbi:hypothetical protein C3L33_02164, partial [Rhododendron williamsianum]